MDEIIVKIVGDVSELRASVDNANATLEDLKTKVDGASSSTSAMSGHMGRLGSELGRVEGHLAGAAAGMGMMGGHIGRIVANLPGMGALFIAAIPIAAIAVGVELYEKWQEHILSVMNTQAESNQVFVKHNDILLEQKERLAGLTGGPMAEYAQKLKDVGEHSVRIAGDLKQITDAVKDQDHWWLRAAASVADYMAAVAEFETGGAIKATTSFGVTQATQFAAGINLAVEKNKDLLGGLEKVNKKIADIEASYSSLSSAQQADTAKGLEILYRLHDDLADHQNIAAGQRKVIEQEAHDKAKSDANTLADADQRNATQRAEHIRQEAEETAKLAKIQALPLEQRVTDVHTVEAVNAQRELTIANAQKTRDAVITEAQATRDNAISAADAIFEAQKKDNDKHIADNTKGAQGLAEIAKKQAGEEEEHRHAVAMANLKYNNVMAEQDRAFLNKKNEAEATAENKTLAITQAAVSKQLEASEKLNKEKAGDALKAEELRISAIEKAGSRGLISHEQELIKLKQEEEAVRRLDQARQQQIQNEIAARQAAAASGSLGKEGDPAYVANQARILELQREQTQATLQYQQALQGIKNIQSQLDNSWTTYFKKLNSESQFSAYSMRTQFQTSLNQMNAGFANSVSQWIEHGGSFGQMMQHLAVHMLSSFVGALVQMAMKQAEVALFGKAIESITNKAKIMDQAALAGASGTATMAGAPWPLDMDAPAFGMQMFMAAASYASAAGGWGQVPKDQMAAIHKDEMVLPAHLSGFLRNAAQNSTGGSSMSIGNMHVHNTINGAFDPSIHSKVMVEGMKKEMRKQGMRIN